MNYPRYPEYKPSGVEWLGEVPAHWGLKRLKYIASHNDDVLPETTDPDYVMQYVDISSVTLANGIEKSEEYTFEKAPSRARRKVRDGDTIVSTVRTYLKAIAPIEAPKDNLVVSTGFAVIRPRTGITPHYLAYQLQTQGFVDAVVANSVGVSYPAINASQLVTLPALIPGEDEQRAIAAFLDRETARIDALIAKKQRLIELLAEKRTALISQAVTKGLNPDAPMKDSSVEWLGEIPAHWDLRRLKDFGALHGGAGFPHEHQGVEGEELPFYKVGDLALAPDGKTLGLPPHSISRALAAELRARIIPQGSVVYAKIGAALFLNRRRISPMPCCIDNNMTAYVTQSEDLSSEWVFYWLSILDFGKLANPGAVPSFSEGYQSMLPLVVPPIEEQRTITAFLDHETQKEKALRDKVESAIEKLKEYRAALITDAVTGKIDVRSFIKEKEVA